MRILVAIGIVTIFCLIFSISIYDFNGYKIPLPHPDIWNNIFIQTIHLMKSNLLPQNVNLIQLTPQGPFLTEIYSALMLSIILVMPIVVREFAGFIGPGLYKREKTVVKIYGICSRTLCRRLFILLLYCYTFYTQLWALTVSGIVEYTFWRSKFRYAITLCTIFGAFITPDGSGVTMWFVAGPMILLYVAGMLVIESKIKRRQQQDQRQRAI
jgi:sec-independent protein translocase protein TatC